MKVTTQESANDCVLIRAEGRIDVTSSPGLEEEIVKLIDQGKRKLVFSFADTVYISSAGLRVFVATGKKLKPMNGDIRLCSMPQNVLKIFQLAGFNKIFKIFETEDEAIQSFQ